MFVITHFCPILFYTKINFLLCSSRRSAFTHITSDLSVQSGVGHDELGPLTIPSQLNALSCSGQKLVFMQSSERSVFTRTIFRFSVQSHVHHHYHSTKHQLSLLILLNWVLIHILSSILVSSSVRAHGLLSTTVSMNINFLLRAGEQSIFTRITYCFSVRSDVHRHCHSTKTKLSVLIQSKVGVYSHQFQFLSQSGIWQ